MLCYVITQLVDVDSLLACLGTIACRPRCSELSLWCL